MRPENEWFKPERLKPYFFVYEGIVAVLVTAVAAAVWYVGVPSDVPLWGVSVPVAAVILVFAYVTWWIPAFYRTAQYRLGDEDLEYRRGVFFQQKTTVPYNRITNVNAHQGPVQRLVRAGSVAVHTAGYGGQMGAELTIGGVEDFEDIKDQVLGKVRHRRPVATEGEDAEADASGTAVLDELRRIRELLEDGRTTD